MFWGLSPALDIQEEYFQYHNDDYEEINILLIGGCDFRHALKTLAQAYRYKHKKINIIIIEGCLELIARQLILLSIAHENPNHLGLLEKSRLYLEIYGNTLIRSSTSKYLIWKSNEIIKMITNLEHMSKTLPNVFFNGIKYRERDYIEILLQFWRMGNTNQFQICEIWDTRLRQSLGCRYDSRSGVFDWDYNMRLRDIGGDTVSSQEFKHFRFTGVAFTWLEVETCRPNYTLAAGVLKHGDNFLHRGYIGDIVTGPYISFGLNCEDEDMMKVLNRTHVKRATDISERNILRMMYELQFQTPFTTDNIKNHNLGLVTFAKIDAKISEEIHSESKVEYNSSANPSINIEFANISFYSPTAFDQFSQKEKFQKYFDVVYSSYNFVEKIDSIILKSVKKDGLIFFETKKFLLNIKKDDIKAFGKCINNIKKKCDCTYLEDFDPLKDALVKLKKN